MRGLNPRCAPFTESTGHAMLPGGYDFIHLVFWPLVGLVALGTNLLPIVLVGGVGIYLLETLRGR